VKSEPLIAAALLAVAAGVGTRVESLGVRLRHPAVLDSPVGADRVTALSTGRKIGADFIWIDLLQYCAEAPFVLEHGARVPRLAGRATDLDPHFVQVYMFAGSALMWQCNRPAEAAALLEKGIAANPRERRLKYYLAAFTFRRLKDFRREMAVLERLAFEPDAPIILRRILANAYEKNRTLDRAAAIWRLVLATSADPAERRWALGKLSRYGMVGVGGGQ
jgi:hypothetical protein